MKISLRKNWLMLFAMLLLFNHSLSAQVLESRMENGTANSNTLPIHGLYNYSYSQMLYFSNELNPSVLGSSSLITKVRFYHVSGMGPENKQWTIFMGNTTQTTFNTSTSWIPSSEMTQTFSGDVSPFVTGAGWFEINLTTPFVYNGTGNIVLGVLENGDGYTTSTFRSHGATVTNRSIYYSTDSRANMPNPATPPSATSRLNVSAQAVFIHSPNSACNGTPTHGATQISSTSICEGKNVVLSYNQSLFQSGFQYVWQKQDGANWTDLATTTSPTYTTTNLTESGVFRVKVICTASSEFDIADEVALTVNPTPSLTVNFSNVSLCDGESIGLIADGAATYAWSPSVGLNTTNLPFVNASITNNTNYKVVGTSANGCKDSTQVNLSLISTMTLPYTLNPTENCTSGTPVSIQATTPTNTILTNNANWEFQFLNSDNTVLQDWSTSNTYTFTPPTDSIYNYGFKARSSQCATTNSLKTSLAITIGFNADAAITNYDCINLGGSIALSNVIGQQELRQIFTNNLITTSPEVVISGSALYANDRLVLTPSATSKNGTAIVTASTSKDFEVNFLMTADQVINTYNTGGADGISYSFGNDVNGYGDLKHNGSGSKLRISFDAADNGSNARGIYIIYGRSSMSTAPTPTEGTTVAHTSNISWKNQSDVPVNINVKNGRLTLTLNGVVIFNQVALPAAYNTENTSSWKHSFAAQTGGDAMRQAISNLTISTENLFYGINQDPTNAPTTWQSSKIFNDLEPGIYNVWMAKSETGCNKMIHEIEILNDNPIINLGRDTVICQGASILLDAGYPDGNYLWSGSGNTMRTLEVTSPGSYMVHVTNPNTHCSGSGIIQIGMLANPTATAILPQVSFENGFFTLTGVSNTTSVDWNFGDGHSVLDGPASISHVFDAKGTFTVTATLKNDCNTFQLSQNITIDKMLAIDEVSEIEGLSVFPNPTQGRVTVTLENADESTINLTDMHGKMMLSNHVFNSETTLNLEKYETGVYFLQVTNNNRTHTLKIMVR